MEALCFLWVVIMIFIAVVLAVNASAQAKRKASEDAANEAMRKENPELYVRVKEMELEAKKLEHERSLKNKEIGKGVAGIAAAMIAKKFIK